MSKEKSKNEINQHKEEALNKLNKLLDKLINSNSPSKADKLAYWFEDYARLLESEDSVTSFNSYKRGDVIKAELGFNIGSEQGGLHYCIVLANSSPYQKVVQVVPLTSIKPHKNLKKLRYGEINIENELYLLLKVKNDILENQYQEQCADIERISDSLSAEEYEARHKAARINLDRSKRVKREINRMKLGSIVLVNQITTISKLRIVDPKNNNSVLYNIRISNNSLNKIDEKIVEMFTKREH